jgi:hypothetical protein
MDVRFGAALSLIVLFGGACATHHAEVADASIGLGSREAVAVAVAPQGAPVALDRFVALTGKKAAQPIGPGFAFVQSTPDIWGPFDVSIHTGFLDAERTAQRAGVQTCLEIDDVGFDVFYDVCGAFDGVDWNVTAFKGKPRVNLAGLVEIDADEIELRAEQTGGNVNFYARAFGSMAWSPVATTAFPAQVEPLKVAFGATGLAKNTTVGFDRLVVPFSGPPSAPAPAVDVAADVNAALVSAYGAFEALDESPDFDDAGLDLDAAADAIDAAQAGAAGLPETKENKKAAKFIDKAEKSLVKALDQVADEDAAKALKTLQKVGGSLIEAALLLNPQPFPPPPQ